MPDDAAKNPPLPLTDEELKIREHLELEEKDPEWASRRALLKDGDRKVKAYLEENKLVLYPKLRTEQRDEYAATVGRAVRAYQKQDGWTEEQKKAHKQEKNRVDKRRQREREAALKAKPTD